MSVGSCLFVKGHTLDSLTASLLVVRCLTVLKYQAVKQFNIGNYLQLPTLSRITFEPLGHVFYSLQCSGLFNSLEQITFPLSSTNPFGFND